MQTHSHLDRLCWREGLLSFRTSGGGQLQHLASLVWKPLLSLTYHTLKGMSGAPSCKLTESQIYEQEVVLKAVLTNSQPKAKGLLSYPRQPKKR